MRLLAVALGEAFGDHVFVSCCLGDFVRGSDPSASAFVLGTAFLVFAVCLLPLLLGAHGKGLLQLGGGGGSGTATLFFKGVDALMGRLELPLQGNDEFDQSIKVDPSLTHFLFELVAGVHADTISNRPSRSCAIGARFQQQPNHHFPETLALENGQLRRERTAMLRREGERPFRRRVTGFYPVMYAPINKLIDKLHSKGFCDKDGWPISKAGWTGLDADQIITLFNGNLWGLLNYYRFVSNFGAMSRIQYILRFSLAKTMAHKYRTSMKKIFRKHGNNLRFCWQMADGRAREVNFKENTDWQNDRDAFMVNPPNIDLLSWQWSLRSKSKLGFPCLICGDYEDVQMHHVRHIRKMGDKKPTGFTAVMRALNRKQVPVCKKCHDGIHRGDYDGISMQDLAYDFAATLV